MKEQIGAIIQNIKKGVVFDSHYIINTLIIENTDTYLKFAAEHKAESKFTEHIHSEIAKLISSSKDIKDSGKNSLSYNIHGKASECRLWEKI